MSKFQNHKSYKSKNIRIIVTESRKQTKVGQVKLGKTSILPCIKLTALSNLVYELYLGSPKGVSKRVSRK